MRKKAILILFVSLLVGAAATTGLAQGANDQYHDVGYLEFTILGGCSLVVDGDYVYNPVSGSDTTPISKYVTLSAWCNLDSYVIKAKAGGPVMMGGSPAADITLNNFEFADDSAASHTLSETDQDWFHGGRTGSTPDVYQAALWLTNRAGNETPGEYTTTVVFTMVAPDLP